MAGKGSIASKLRSLGLFRSQVTPSGLGTLSIGDAINLADPLTILYSDATSNLGSTLNFAYDPATGNFDVYKPGGGFQRWLAVDGNTNEFYFGDFDGANNGTYVMLNDNTPELSLVAAYLYGISANGNTGVTHVGTAQGFGNETYIHIDDSTQEITLSSLSGARVNIYGGLSNNAIRPAAFGTTPVCGINDYHFIFSGAAGASGVDISSASLAIGQIIVVSDLDRASAGNNITIDAGVGNTIVTSASAAQTFVMATNGLSVTLQKVTATQWMLVSRNT